MKRSLTHSISIAALAALTASAVFAQDNGASEGQSREMRAAVRSYEKGDDMQAMDRFMEILTKGDPAERSMANEYINLITRRMNSAPGSSAAPSPVPPPAPPPAPAQIVTPAPPAQTVPTTSAPEPAPAPRPPEMRTPAPVSAPSAPKTVFDAALMRREIGQRLRAAQTRSMDDLRAIPGVRALARADGQPEAVGLPPSLLFKSGIAFRRDASRVLNPLARLIFASGGAQVILLPEGTAAGQAKVLDMRRVMGISSALYDAGIAPPRVRVNLLNSQVDIPKELLDFKGILVVFIYGRSMNLSVESSIGDEAGPPISLGIFPSRLRPERNEGGLIEFSISDPPSGISSWNFQLLAPSAGSAEPVPLQEVSGGGPAFHQIFWNGRKEYFGAPLPPGRYECVLSARDGKGRVRVLRRWIDLLGAPPERQAKENPRAATAGSAPVRARAAGAPSADLPGARFKPLLRAKRRARARPKPRRKALRAARAKARRRRAASRAPAAPAGRYVLRFTPNAYQMSAAAESSLSKAAAALSNGAYQSVVVLGRAAPDEDAPDVLARQRARMVAGLLINRYQIAPDRIMVSTDAASGSSVELTLSGGGP